MMSEQHSFIRSESLTAQQLVILYKLKLHGSRLDSTDPLSNLKPKNLIWTTEPVFAIVKQPDYDQRTQAEGT